MNRNLMPVVGVLALALSACGQVPKTPQQFRDLTANSMWHDQEAVVVQRPYRQVSQSFSDQAEKCLNVIVEVAYSDGYGYFEKQYQYHPTVNVDAGRTELILQREFLPGPDSNPLNLPSVELNELPDGGELLFVADAFPDTATSTQVEIYAPTMDYEPLIAAVRGWAAGTTTGCPTL